MGREAARPRVHEPRPLLVALALLCAIVLGAISPWPAGRSAEPTATSVSSGQPSAALVRGDDACDLLTDREVLKVTGARSVTSRTPGPQDTMPAGCVIELKGRGQTYGQPWTVKVGVQLSGGAARFEQEVASFGGEPVKEAGSVLYRNPLLGDRWAAVTGDAMTSVLVFTFAVGRKKADGDRARKLVRSVVERLVPISVPRPSASPAPDARSEVRTLVEHLRAPSFGPDVVDAAVTILARSGVATFASPTDTEPLVPITGPESPLALLVDQVRAVALEAWAGGGIGAEDLDALAPAEPDLPGGADVLLGYVAGAETEGGMVARMLLGDVDIRSPERVYYPQLVLLLMVADVARELASPSSTESAGTAPVVAAYAIAEAPATGGPVLADAPGPRTAQGSVCSAVTRFIDGTLSRVFDALRSVPTRIVSGGFFGSIWNVVVDVAEFTARKILKEVTQPVLDKIASVAATVGLASIIVSAIRPWALSVTALPPVTVKGVGGMPGQDGRFQVQVNLPGLDEWPEPVRDCAEIAGQPLPDLKPVGALVTWAPVTQLPSGLIAEGTREARLDKDATARLDFTTLVDDIPAPWQEVPGWIGVRVTVARPQLEQLRRLATDQLLAQIPSIVRPALVPWLRPIIESVTRQFDTLITTSRSGFGTVLYHVPAPTPRPGATPMPTTPPRAVMVRADRPADGALLAGRIVDLVSCDGPYGHWRGVLRTAGMSAPTVEIPFVDMPLDFTLPGAGGMRTVSTTASGMLRSNIDRLETPFTFTLTIAVDGRTMSIDGMVDLTIPAGMDVTLTSNGGWLRDLPIVPAPEGACP